MSDFNDLLGEIDKGREGKTRWIPLYHTKLSQHIGIGKRIYTIIGGGSGLGKTSLLDWTYVLCPYNWILKNKDKTDIKIKIIYRSMERSKTYKLAKWVCLRLYIKYGILLDVPTILGWGSKKKNISQELYDKIIESKGYFDNMLDTVELIDGPVNPTGIYKKIQETALKDGKVEKVTEYEKKYIPNDPNLITLHITDHIGKLRKEHHDGVYLTDKGLLDKHSEYMTIARDFYGWAPIDVCQFNRGLESTYRAVKTDLTPQASDFKGSGNMFENCDIALALFNPYKSKVMDHMGYKIDKFVDKEGNNRFRSLTCLKNSYGIDDFRIGFLFIGQCGFLMELPPAKDLKDSDYEDIIKGGQTKLL